MSSTTVTTTGITTASPPPPAASRFDEPSPDTRRALAEIADAHGVAYVYDLTGVETTVRRTVHQLEPVELFYALKANPLRELVELMVKHGIGIEVASIGEVDYCIALGAPPHRMAFAGPGKSEEDVHAAVRAGVGYLHAESWTEVRAAARALAEPGTASPTIVALRVNTLREQAARLENMSGGPSRFGVDEETIADAIHDHAQIVKGMHHYPGSQIDQVSELVANTESLLSVARRLHPTVGPLRHLDLGGGFAVPMDSTDAAVDVAEYARYLHGIDWSTLMSAGTHPSLELGRYLVAAHGVFLARVLATKFSRGTNYLITEGGMNDFVRPVLTGQTHRVSLLTPRPGPTMPWTVTGPLCTPLDVIGSVAATAPEPGDVVVVHQAGAYGWSMSPQFFLGHPTAAETVLDCATDGSWRTVRSRIPMTTYMQMGRTS